MGKQTANRNWVCLKAMSKPKWKWRCSPICKYGQAPRRTAAVEVQADVKVMQRPRAIAGTSAFRLHFSMRAAFCFVGGARSGSRDVAVAVAAAAPTSICRLGKYLIAFRYLCSGICEWMPHRAQYLRQRDRGISRHKDSQVEAELCWAGCRRQPRKIRRSSSSSSLCLYFLFISFSFFFCIFDFYN